MKKQLRGKTSERNALLACLAKVSNEMIESNPQACKTDEIPQGIGRFGLDITNPIPVHGISDNVAYLSRLRLENGEKIAWQRGGCLMVKNITSMIDCYEITDLNGNSIAALYLCSYHSKTSNKAPLGFKLV